MSSKMTGEDIGINTLDPKVRLHINNGAVFVDSGGLNPNSTPLNSYYNTGNETSPQIILGNEDAWDSTDQNSPQSSIKCRLLNYNGQGFRATVNDGTVVYDHTSNQWQSRTFDYDGYPSQYLSLNELTNTNQGGGVLLSCGLYVSGNYTGSLSDGNRMSLHADGSLKITGHLTIENSDASGGTPSSAGTIRYNILTNDFEGYTNQWVSLTTPQNIGSQVTLFTTPVIFDLNDFDALPTALNSSGQDSDWKRLNYSSVDSGIPAGSALIVRVAGLYSAFYEPSSYIYLHTDDVANSSDDALDFFSHGWYFSADTGATSGGGNLGGRCYSVNEGYLIPNEGIQSTTNSVLLSRGSFSTLKFMVLGYVQMY